MSHKIVIYTDGACRGNPGIGGWGALLLSNDHQKEIFGGERHTTNNRMELTAAIKALECLKRPSEVTLYTDSSYVKNGIEQWLAKWKRNNWRTSGKSAVKNKDLWEQLDALTTQHQITWQWVRGHTGNIGNERADQLANQGIDELK